MAGKAPELDAVSTWCFPVGNHTVPGLVDAYAECTAVVSMRKHGIYIPAGLGVPVVGLGDLAEVGSICEQLGVHCVTSSNVSPHIFMDVIENATYHPPLPYDTLCTAHDSHIKIIQEALA